MHRNYFYTQKLLHTDAFTHKNFYTQKLLHTEAFTQTLLHTKLLPTEAFTDRSFYTHTLLHTDAFTHRSFYTQTPGQLGNHNFTAVFGDGTSFRAKGLRGTS